MINTFNEQIAWAAGLFEGEGTIVHRKTNGSKNGWTLSISSTDKDVLEKFFKIVGCGKLYGPYGYANDSNRRREHHKPYWRWSVADKNGVIKLGNLFMPWLCFRRKEKLLECLQHLEENVKFTRETHKNIIDN